MARPIPTVIPHRRLRTLRKSQPEGEREEEEEEKEEEGGERGSSPEYYSLCCVLTSVTKRKLNLLNGDLERGGVTVSMKGSGRPVSPPDGDVNRKQSDLHISIRWRPATTGFSTGGASQGHGAGVGRGTGVNTTKSNICSGFFPP